MSNNTNGNEDENMEEIPNMNSSITVDEYHEEFLRFLNESNEMKNITKHSLKHGLYAGGGALVGAAALGPVGGLIGGCVGSAVGYMTSKEYDGVIQGVLKLDNDKKKVVLKQVTTVLMNAGATIQQISTSDGFRDALFDLANNKKVRDGLWNIVLNNKTN